MTKKWAKTLEDFESKVFNGQTKADTQQVLNRPSKISTAWVLHKIPRNLVLFS